MLGPIQQGMRNVVLISGPHQKKRSEQRRLLTVAVHACEPEYLDRDC